MRKTVTIDRNVFILLLVTIAVNLGFTASRVVDYIRWDRPMAQCLKDHVYRCDIGDTRIYVTYRDGADDGPDE